MQCPNDGALLTMSDRSGIEIDYCPTCRGVWLDRGELDKIIERSLTASPPRQRRPPPQPPSQPQYQRQQQPAVVRAALRGQRQLLSKKKRKESWLSELFD